VAFVGSRLHRVAFVGLVPPRKDPSPHKLNYEALYIGGAISNFRMSITPEQMYSPSIEKFLLTLLQGRVSSKTVEGNGNL